MARFKDPKTKAGSRTIPLRPQFAPVLNRWKLAAPVNEHDLVFPDELSRPMRPSKSLEVLRDMQEATELRRLDVKALRSTFATALIDAGEVATQVARLLGHADTTVTLKVYTQAYQKKGEINKGLQNLVDAVFGKMAEKP